MGDRAALLSALLSASLLAHGCARDPVPLGTITDAAVVTDLASPPWDVAAPIRDLARTGDLSRAACVGLEQPQDRVSGMAAGYPFIAQIGVAGWQWGEGSCDGQSTVYLFDGALPSEDRIPIAQGLRIVDQARLSADLGAVHPVSVVYIGPQSALTAMGTVEWIRRDDFHQPGGVLEGILSVDKPTWSLKGHFVAQRCEGLDLICI